MQYVYSATVADNNWRLNYTGRNSSGLVTTFAANLFNVYADGRVILNPATSGVTASAKLLIGTSTDAGFRLDVNGTARVQGLFSALNSSTQGIVLANNTGNFPAVEFWAGTKRAEIVRESNNGLTIRAGTFSMFTSTNGTLVGGTSLSDLNASAQLQVDATTRGFLPPRMTTAQRDLIGTPAAGLVIYNTSTNTHQGYNGTTWNNFY
jgi:hypothetical protein